MKQLKDHLILLEKHKKTLILFVFFIISIFLFIILNGLDRKQQLEIIFLDVGQGDSTLLRSPYGQKILIDTGPNFITSQKIEKYLSLFSSGLDIIILSHPDSDHVGGTSDVLKNIWTKNLIISTENTYENYGGINSDMITKKLNNTYKISFSQGFDLNILSPKINSIGSDNQNSLINDLRYGNFEFIFMADADVEVERRLVSEGFFEKDSIKILKIGHHGSDTSSSEIFLKALKPEYCIISVGQDNKYGHPNKSVLEKLEKYCKNIYRTDQNGDIIFKTDGEDLFIKKEK